jgi:CheY-like chemotaxis protein
MMNSEKKGSHMLSENNTFQHPNLFEIPDLFGDIPELNTRHFKKILIIDDNQEIRLALADLLVNEGYSVMTARNGQDGLEHLLKEREQPDLILLDMKMPIKDGGQFLQEQCQLPEISHIPVVVISGEMTLEELRNLPVRSCVQKPFNWIEVVETVKLCSQKSN